MSEEKNDIGTIIESVNGSDIMNNYFLGYATYTICDIPLYHITHVLLRSHVLACIPYWQV